jgi:hypothetical protein
MRRFAILLLTSFALAQLIPQPNPPKAPEHKTYTMTADQQARLKKVTDDLNDAERRHDNDSFHAKHHAWWNMCNQIKTELKADSAAYCDRETYEVKQ